MLWILIIATIFALDQITKFLIIKYLEYGTSIKIINDFFYIAHYKNRGAAWGILQNQRYLFVILTSIVSLILLWYLYKKANVTILKVSLSIILGGAFGNLYDRIFRASVVDFLDFWFWKYNFPTFNVADSAVVIGTILLSYYLLFIYKEEKKV